MRMEDVDARKAYIQRIRHSFDDPGRKYEFEKETITKGEAHEGFSFFKARLLAAVLIFAAYIFCDKTETRFYQLSTNDVAKEIVKDYDYNRAKEEALQVFHFLEPPKF